MKLSMSALPGWLAGLKGRPRDIATFVAYAAKRYWDDNCFRIAAQLAYTSLLAVVPVMTIGFAIFTAFPAYSELQEIGQTLIFNNLIPQVGEVVWENIVRFTSNAGQLTAFGVIGLAVTGILLFNTIEASFNEIWRAFETRQLVVRLLAFWAVLTLSPLLFGASLSASSELAAWFGPGGFRGVQGGAALLPGLFEFIGFTLLYALIPNRNVRWRDAALGGLTAATLFEVAKIGFAWYLASFPAYQTIYGAVSAIPIFLVWLYLSWSTVLIGAEVTAALPEWRAGKISKIGPEGLLPAQRLSVALAILKELHAASHFGIPITRRTIAGRVPVGAAVVDGMLDQLRHARFVEKTARNAWVLTRDLGDATLYDLQRALGIGLRGPVQGVGSIEASWLDRTAELLRLADDSDRAVLGISLKQLLTGGESASLDQPSPALRRTS